MRKLLDKFDSKFDPPNGVLNLSQIKECIDLGSLIEFLKKTKITRLIYEKWGTKYPIVIKSWQTKWDYLSAYFKYTRAIRRLIYTTNPIEGFHRQVRKYTKSKGAFTSENALFKLIYSAIQQIKK